MPTSLFIITPVTRPSNLPALYNNLLTYVSKELTMTWCVVFDKKCYEAGREWKERFSRSQNPNLSILCVLSHTENAPAGNENRNAALILLEAHLLEAKDEKINSVAESWVYFLDDNNILHFDFCKILLETNLSNAGLLFFSSTDNKHSALINISFTHFTEQPEDGIKKIPLSFFCVRSKYIKGLRFTPLGEKYNYDFVKALVQRVPEKERQSFLRPTFDNYYS
jgi:hypothetical protein